MWSNLTTTLNSLQVFSKISTCGSNLLSLRTEPLFSCRLLGSTQSLLNCIRMVLVHWVLEEFSNWTKCFFWQLGALPQIRRARHKHRLAGVICTVCRMRFVRWACFKQAHPFLLWQQVCGFHCQFQTVIHTKIHGFSSSPDATYSQI